MTAHPAEPVPVTDFDAMIAALPPATQAAIEARYQELRASIEPVPVALDTTLTCASAHEHQVNVASEPVAVAQGDVATISELLSQLRAAVERQQAYHREDQSALRALRARVEAAPKVAITACNQIPGASDFDYGDLSAACQQFKPGTYVRLLAVPAAEVGNG